MKAFQIEGQETKTTAWIYPETDGDFDPVHGEPEADRVAVELRYVTPRQREAYRRKLLQKGILKKKFRGGDEFYEDVPGREADRDLLFVETFIAGWAGFLGPDKMSLSYSPEKMAELMSKHVWLNRSITKALQELDSFFVGNGNGSSSS